MPLHIDCRPESWEEIIGNKTTVSSLKSVLGREDKPHVYLFYGPAGCGKTTLARIVANHLSCSGNDLQEINSSNNRGIDTAREIISNMYYKPLSSPVRVYILDEVHKTTKEFQNALLKVLEDTPPHVYFILCTTDPDQLLTAIRSRCSTFSVQKPKAEEIEGMMSRICKRKKIKISEEVLKEIADNVDSPRHALVVLDQVRDSKEKDITKIILNSQIEEKQIIDLCKKLASSKSSWSSIAPIIKGLGADVDPEKVRRAVLGYMTYLLLQGDNPKAALVIDCFKDNFFNTGKAGLVYACYISVT